MIPSSSLGVSKITPPPRSRIPSCPEPHSECDVALRSRDATLSTPSALVVQTNFDGFLRYTIVNCFQFTPTMGFVSYQGSILKRGSQFQLSEIDRNRFRKVTVVNWGLSDQIQCLGYAYPSEFSPLSWPMLRLRNTLPSRCCLWLRILCSLCESNSNATAPSASRPCAVKESVVPINQTIYQNPILPWA